MVIFEKADIFLLNQWKHWSPEVNFFGIFWDLGYVQRYDNFLKADILYINIQRKH